MPKEYNPFRTRFTKACANDQLRVVKKVVNNHPSLLDAVKVLTSVDPYVSFLDNGRITFLSDKHLLKS